MLRVGLLVAMALVVFAASEATVAEARIDPQAALSEGNRLFGDERFEAAVAAYLEGYAPRAPDPTLFYNLGTTLHHLNRLPEAILWYRRAAGVNDPSRLWPAKTSPSSGSSRLWRADDPWLEENLWLARRSLGSQILPAGGLIGWLEGNTDGLRAVGIAIAWMTLLLVVVSRRLPSWQLITAAILATATYGGAVAVDRWGPRPAVILEDCLTAAGSLPAGTELWVRPAAGGWRVSSSAELTCPPEVVGLVIP